MTALPNWIVFIPPILSLQLGLFVFLADWRATLNQLVLATSMAVSLWNLETAQGVAHYPAAVTVLLHSGALFLPATFLHLVVAYNQPYSRLWRRPVTAAYLAAFASALMAAIPGWRWASAIGITLFGLYFACANGFSLALLLQRYITATGSDRRQVLWVALSAVAAIVSSVLSLFLRHVHGFHLLNGIATFVYVAAVAQAVLLYRFGNTNARFRLGAIYSLALGAVVAAYVLVVMAASRFVAVRWHVSSLLVAFFFTLIVGPFAYPVKESVERLVRRFLPLPKDLYYAGLKNFSQELNFLAPLPQLADLLAVRISNLLELDVVVLAITPERVEPFLRAVTNTEGWPHSQLLPLPADALLDAESLTALSGLPVNATLPLESHGREVGMLGLGRHRDGEDLSREDWEVIVALSHQAGIAVENAELFSELVELKNHYVSVIESSLSAVLVVTRDLVIVDLNDASAKAFGGRALLNDAELADVPALAELRPLVTKVLETGEPVMGQRVALVGPEGLVEYAVNISQLYGQRRAKPEGVVLMLSDITNIREMENQVERAERLAAMGHLAAGLAHEIRNGLNKIGGYATMLQDSLAVDDPLQRFPTGIIEDSASLESLLRRFLSFAREEKHRDEVIDLAPLVTKVLEPLGREFQQRHVHLTTLLASDTPAVRGDQAQLQQAVTNLTLNSLDAMEQGGELTVTVRPGNGNNAEVEIMDTGVGIPPGQLELIFNPFYTTKASGTGLGLPITHRIITQHGGTLTVKSQAGVGTRMIITLPPAPSDRREHACE